jgi:hypothetical protein
LRLCLFELALSYLNIQIKIKPLPGRAIKLFLTNAIIYQLISAPAGIRTPNLLIRSWPVNLSF